MVKNLNIYAPGVTESHLKRTPMIGVARLVTVLVMSLSWFALSNHCELAAAVGLLQEQSDSCCKKDKSAETAPVKNDQRNGSECCKAAHPAVLTSAGTKPVSSDLSCAPHSFVVAPVVFPDGPRSASIIELDTGPPFARSFAEAVLQQSLLAHAPPCLI